MRRLIICLTILLTSSCAHNSNFSSGENYRNVSSEGMSKDDKAIVNKYVKMIEARLVDVAEIDYEKSFLEIMNEFNNGNDQRYIAQAIGQVIYDRVYSRKLSKDPALNGGLNALLSGDTHAKNTAVYIARDLSGAYGSERNSYRETIPFSEFLIDYDDEDLLRKLMHTSGEYFSFSGFIIEKAVMEKNTKFLGLVEEWVGENPDHAKLLVKTIDGAHGESSPLWDHEERLPNYISKHLDHPKESKLSQKYFTRTGKVYVENVDEAVPFLDLMSIKQRELLANPQKLTPKLLKEFIDGKIERLAEAIDGNTFMSTPGRINGTIDGLEVFLDHALTKSRFAIKENEILLNVLLGPKGEKILKAIRKSQVFDQLEEYITRFYLPVLPDASDAALTKIKNIRNLKTKALNDSGPAKVTIKNEVKASKINSSAISCNEIAISIFSKK